MSNRWINSRGSGHLSPATRNAAKRVLGGALRRAMQEDLVYRNAAYIADGVRVPRTERRSLTMAQARILLDAFKHDRLGVAYALGLVLGLRRGEILGLRWADIDLDGQPPTVAVRRQLQRRQGRGLVLTELKTTKSRRTLVLPKQLAYDLRHLRVAQGGGRLAAGPLWAETRRRGGAGDLDYPRAATLRRVIALCYGRPDEGDQRDPRALHRARDQRGLRAPPGRAAGDRSRRHDRCAMGLGTTSWAELDSTRTSSASCRSSTTSPGVRASSPPTQHGRSLAGVAGPPLMSPDQFQGVTPHHGEHLGIEGPPATIFFRRWFSRWSSFNSLHAICLHAPPPAMPGGLGDLEVSADPPRDLGLGRGGSLLQASLRMICSGVWRRLFIVVVLLPRGGV